MDNPIRFTVIVILAVLFGVGAYHRIRSQINGEPLDRSKEGWPIMIGIRSFGLAGVVQVILLLRRTSALDWAHVPLPVTVRWCGVAMIAAAAFWLSWMFQSLGRNLTDTVVTRSDATFVEHGPYRYVRNPMYTGVLVLCLGIGVALENLSVPVTIVVVFTLFAIRTRTEEKYLIERFGDTYRNYMQRVGRFLP